MSRLDDYEFYEQQVAAKYGDANSHRQQKRQHRAKKKHQSDIHDVADTQGLEAGFKTTYKPSRYETMWLMSSLETFYDQELITDVLSIVKGGKEASVYCCRANPSMGVELVAAKVYRPRMFRQLRNDGMYREGRQILTGDGRPVKETDHRVMRAVNKKTAFGAEVSHQSWLLHEYTTLKELFNAGAAVPQPYAVGNNAILMSYYGDAVNGAPPLSYVQLDDDEAPALFQNTMDNIALMLQHQLVHGDLSAYNILYWEGEITLIDFPQVTSLNGNSNARSILQRDIMRVCEYFAKQGVESEPQELFETLWNKYSNVIVDPPEETDETWE